MNTNLTFRVNFNVRMLYLVAAPRLADNAQLSEKIDDEAVSVVVLYGGDDRIDDTITATREHF